MEEGSIWIGGKSNVVNRECQDWWTMTAKASWMDCLRATVMASRKDQWRATDCDGFAKGSMEGDCQGLIG
jgi:hypothetical protein